MLSRTINGLALFSFLTLCGCANPLNIHTSKNYFQSGMTLISENNWYEGRIAFGRAWANAEMGKADINFTTVCAYEFGRASGAICDWEQAEKGLKSALKLDEKSGGPIHMTFIELARMYHAKGDLSESQKYFKLGKAELDKHSADTRDAIGYAKIIDEYSDVLKTVGELEEAEILKQRAQEIRNVFKGRKSSHNQTPYGEFCHQAQ